MADNPNRLSQFWQELKRRRVIHVITVYATSAFVIIELVNNLTEPLHLPPNLATIVIIVLAVGFPLAIILSWLYDLTSEGVEKTKPIEKVKEGEKPVIPNAWRIATYMSFVVIAGLVVLNIVGGSKLLRAGDIQSLLILPFENYTGDDQLDMVISGMHSSLIGDVGKISGLKVISKTTADYYKDADMTLSEIASELGVDAVVEPAVMCYGDSICFELKMISPEEEQIWIAEYQEQKSQILNLSNLVTKQIADEVKIELSADEELLLAESREVDPDAVDAYFKGLAYLDMINRNSLQKAKEYFNIAVEIEPDWAHPFAGLAEAVAYQNQMSFISPSIAIPEIYKNLNKALELDPNSSNAHYIKAIIAVWTEWNWEKGEQEFVKSLELNPNNALCRSFYAHLLTILQRPDEAIYQANLAVNLDPLRPFILGLCAGILGEGNKQITILYLKKILSIEPNHRLAIVKLGFVYRAMGDYEKWFEYWKITTRYDDEVIAEIDTVFHEKGYLAATEMILKIEEEASKERQINIGGQVSRYLEIKEYDKAMDWLEKSYEIRSPSMPYIGSLVKNYEQLRDNPRYIELLKKMNLPLPGG
jgi:adenylate cyclase